jgi:hypothetical protein
MMNLDYPANAEFFANTIISILNVDVLSPEYINQALFNFTSDESLMQLLNDPNSTYSYLNILIPTIQEMGFESYNAILNLQGLFVVFILVAAEYILLAFALIILYLLEAMRKREKAQYEGGSRRNKCAKKCLQKVGPVIKRFKHSMVYN